MKKEIWVEKLRVFATMAVILLHVVGGVYVNEPAEIPQYRRIFDLSLLIAVSDWAVPVFLMITGYLLLDEKKNLSNGKLTGYIKRMIYVLLTFGFGYCLIESFVNYRNEGVGKILGDAIINLITGNSWAHMWYVYMLIGIYAVTPIIKTFVNKASDKLLIYILILFFVMTIVLPTVNYCTGIKISRLYIFGAPYIFYYIFGYSVRRINIDAKWWWILGTVSFVSMIITENINLNYKNSVFEYDNVCVALIAMSIFTLSYMHSQNNDKQEHRDKLIIYLSKRSFCIYLVHAFFLNLLNKGFDMYPTDLPILVGEVVFALTALVGSLVVYEILVRLPFIKNII